jgi:hypothetical protein
MKPMTDPTPTPGAPVPPDELLIRTYQAAYQPAWERGEFHGAHVDGPKLSIEVQLRTATKYDLATLRGECDDD